MNARIFFLKVVLAVVSITAYGQEPDGSLLIRVLPELRAVPDFVGDGTAHRFSAATIVELRQAAVSVGGTLPWLDVLLPGIPVQVSSGASVRGRLDPGASIAVISTEFFIDYFILDVAVVPDFIVRAGLGHTSHHLGDSMVDSTQSPRDYSKDYVNVMVIHKFGRSEGLIYGGMKYTYYFVAGRQLHKPVTVQCGFSGTALHLTAFVSLYGGYDMKLWQEYKFGVTHRLEMGIVYTNGRGRFVRLGLAYAAGLDERGQFFGEREKQTSLGLSFEF